MAKGMQGGHVGSIVTQGGIKPPASPHGKPMTPPSLAHAAKLPGGSPSKSPSAAPSVATSIPKSSNGIVKNQYTKPQ